MFRIIPENSPEPTPPGPGEAHACLALGSNLGDRLATLRRAVEAISHLPDTRLLAVSHAYETAPVGPPGQEPYLNAAAAVATALPPATLLIRLQQIERDAGRPPESQRQHWGPRTLDLDLLLYDRVVLDQPADPNDPQAPALHLPHPAMLERWFVLKPLAEIAPDVVHPLRNQCIAQLLAELEANEE
ncbi:MAG: 2-amino-4-hydroxy-6-hydroxymethyldihydropteridine diphosphokinase [Phycisphaeraceae bacterium]